MRTSPGQAAFERAQKINRAYEEYKAGKIDSAECMKRVQEAERERPRG
jgi:hypothetical protein